MSWWTIAWIIWILSFFAIEIPAIRNDVPHDTLSEHTRRWFSTKTRLGRTVWLFVSGAFAAWFIVHIAVAGSI